MGYSSIFGDTTPQAAPAPAPDPAASYQPVGKIFRRADGAWIDLGTGQFVPGHEAPPPGAADSPEVANAKATDPYGYAKSQIQSGQISSISNADLQEFATHFGWDAVYGPSGPFGDGYGYVQADGPNGEPIYVPTGVPDQPGYGGLTPEQRQSLASIGASAYGATPHDPGQQLGPLGAVAPGQFVGATAGTVVGGLDGATGGLAGGGSSGPAYGSRADLAADLGATRGIRDTAFDQFANYTPGTVPMMDAATIRRTTLAPAAQAADVNIGPMAQAGFTGANAYTAEAQQAGFRAYSAALASGASADAAQAAYTQAAGAQIAANERAAATPIDKRAQNETRESQLGNIHMLEDFAAGRVMSPEELALRRATDTNIAQQRGLAVAAGRGGNTALAQRNAARNIAQMDQMAAGQMAEAALRSRMASAQSLAQAVAAARSSDIGLATDEAQMATDVSKFNAGESNTTNRTQAQLAQDLSKFNAGNMIDVSKFNAGQATDVSKFNAGQAQDLSKFNAGQTNDAAQFGANAYNTNQQFNAGQVNDIANANAARLTDVSKTNAGNMIDVSKFNTGQTNTATVEQAKLDAQNNQFNAGQTNQTNIAQGNITSGESKAQAELDQGAAKNNQDATIQTRTQDITDRNNLANNAIQAGSSAIQGDTGAMNADATREGAQMAFKGSMMGTLGQIGAAALSDKRAKTEIKSGARDISDTLRALEFGGPKSYRYKDPDQDGAGERVGKLAQDVEKGAPEMVVDTPKGKALHVDLSSMLAMFGDLNRRVRMLER